VRAMRCQRRTGEGRASSLTCAYASAASSMPLTEAAWRREHAAHHMAASETQRAACEHARGNTLGWAYRCRRLGRRCCGARARMRRCGKAAPQKETAKTNGGHSGRKLPGTPTTAFSRPEGLRGECESEVLHCTCYYAQT
jgi:hypothetical protein